MTDNEHPLYATCTGCTQVKGVKRNGLMKTHNRFAGGGNWQATVECAGSDRPYAEASRRRWDARKSAWVDMPIEVVTTLHTLDGELGPFIVESHPFPQAKAGYEIFTRDGFSVHLHLTEKTRFADVYTAELRDKSDAVAKVEIGVRDDGSVNGLMLRWLEQLAEEAKGATS